MNITIRQPFLEKCRVVKSVDEFLRYNSWNKKSQMQVDLAGLTAAEFTKVVKVLKEDEILNARALRSVALYEAAKANPKNVVSKTLEQFAVALKDYIAQVPKYRVYQENDEGDWNAYVCTDVGFMKAKRIRGGIIPAYTFLKAAYYSRGSVEHSQWNFHIEDIRNKGCAEVIDDSCLISGSTDLDARYEAEVARYKELRGAVGKQMWGKGQCESVGSRWDRRSYSLDVDGRRAKLVVDDHVEGTDRNKNESTDGEAPVLDASFWKNSRVSDDVGNEISQAEEDATEVLEVPLRPTVLLFNLEKHEQCWAHVNRLETYVYDKTLGEKLVLPEYQKELIEILVQRDRAEMQDIISGKAGGSIVLCSGVPGTGKTLTAEVFAETIERPLYVVASSQLGTNPGELEKELKEVLNRADRLGAIMLLDECDVYIHERGESMVQNAVVGVFLRVLEYFQGVLFLTTNRATVVDDAIVSRCTAQVKFEIPTTEGQRKIWDILSGLSKIKIVAKDVEKFVKAHPKLSGRDVKGLLKLANMISVKRGKAVDFEMLEYVMRFKPTHESSTRDREELK